MPLIKKFREVAQNLTNRNRQAPAAVPSPAVAPQPAVAPKPAVARPAAIVATPKPANAASEFKQAEVAPPTAVAPTPETASVKAVRKMRELVQTGQLKTYYDAAIGVGHPELKDEALKLFDDLPKINIQSSADDLVALGLWSQKPAGIEQMQKSARFLPGRQVIVETTVHSDLFDNQSFLSFKEGGLKARTYRATLEGESGSDFLVKVDGKDELIKVPKNKVYEANQPHVYTADVIKRDGWSASKTIDYNSPFMKAKLAEAAIKMEPMVAKLDFTKVATEGGKGLGKIMGGGEGETMVALQRQCVKAAYDVINMLYPHGDTSQPGRYTGDDAGRLAVCGVGMCVEQATVMLGMLEPFSDMLGVDIQFVHGPVYRAVRPGAENPFVGGEGHGWLQLTYRPSMELRICDRTWNQPDHPADKAYSRYGDRYNVGNLGKVAPLKATDEDMTGNVSVATFERQFGVKGEDGREHHMSVTQGGV